MIRLVRYSSTFAKLWIKHESGLPIQISTAGCNNVNAFKRRIQAELSPKLDSFAIHEITLHESLSEKTPLDLSLPLSSSSTVGLSANLPLHVKNMSYAKTIYIQNFGADCYPSDSFTRVLVETEADLNEIYSRKGEALVDISEPKTLLTKLRQLKDGVGYRVYSFDGAAFISIKRQKKEEDRAMEEEIYLAMKRSLDHHLGTAAIELSMETLESDEKDLFQGWDTVYTAREELYLCKAMHHVTPMKVSRIFKQFKKFQVDSQPKLKDSKKIVVVVCGTFFAEQVQKYAKNLGFISVYPSGYLYGLPKEFIVRR